MARGRRRGKNVRMRMISLLIKYIFIYALAEDKKMHICIGHRISM